MSWPSTFLHHAFRVDRSRFDLALGIVAGILIVAPLLLGEATGTLDAGVFATLGALNLTLAVVGAGRGARLPPLAIAAVTNAVAFGAGAIVGTTGLAAIPLVALGVGLILIGAAWARVDSVGLVTSAMFVIGIGIQGGSTAVAPDRSVLVLVGGLWALLGIALARTYLRRYGAPAPPAAIPPPRAGSVWDVLASEHLQYALVVAGATAAGLALSIAIGLPRDYWVMLTIVVSLRSTLSTTFSSSFLRIVGTIGGAVIALGITVSITDPWVLTVILFGLALALFSTRWMNYGIYAFFLTPFVIVLLNIPYPGNWQLSLSRVLDTAIGGALAITAATLWWLGDREGRVGPPLAAPRA